LDHFPFSKGIRDWFDRHNRYSSMEVAQANKALDEPIGIAALFRGEPTGRRRALKKLAYRVPLRPLMVFLYLYVLRGGLLDGRGGVYFSCMRAMYQALIDIKRIEAARGEHGRPV